MPCAVPAARAEARQLSRTMAPSRRAGPPHKRPDLIAPPTTVHMSVDVLADRRHDTVLLFASVGWVARALREPDIDRRFTPIGDGIDACAVDGWRTLHPHRADAATS